MALRKQVADLVSEVRKLRALIESHPTAADLTRVRDDLAKVHGEVKAARDDAAGAASVTQASLKAVAQNLGGVLQKAAELAGTPVPSPAPAAAPSPRKAAAAKAADSSTSGKETP